MFDRKRILCRGIGYDGEWHYGEYRYANSDAFHEDRHEIFDGVVGFNCRPETIGQFTGLKDSNGNRLYEGDVIRSYIPTRTFDECFLIAWREEAAAFVYLQGESYRFMNGFHESCVLECLGNIHMEPELLEKVPQFTKAGYRKKLEKIILDHKEEKK